MDERDQHLSHAACCRRHSALEDTRALCNCGGHEKAGSGRPVIPVALAGAFQGLIRLARSHPQEDWRFFLGKVTWLHASGRQEEPL